MAGKIKYGNHWDNETVLGGPVGSVGHPSRGQGAHCHVLIHTNDPKALPALWYTTVGICIQHLHGRRMWGGKSK